MKKTLLIGMTLGSAVLVAACGDTATVEDDTTKKSDLTLEEVYEKTLERQQELKSAKADMAVEQNIEVEMEGETAEINTSSDLTMDMVVDPIQLYAKGETTMVDSESGEEMSMPTEIYMTEDDGFFMYQDFMGGWIKMPSEEYDAMMNQAGMQTDASEQLRQLQQFVEDFTFKQDDDQYILTLEAEGEKFLQFILDQAKAALGSTAEEMTADMENMTIDEAKYILYIDKETFNLENMEMDLVMTMQVEGQTLKMSQNTTADYSEFDTIDAITIPQDVIDSAQVLE
ncbi:MAG: DUF6612 family protein [Lysinibacillus sp.]